MTRPIVTPKRANATPPAKGGGCTSPRPTRNAALKTLRDRDFAFLVKTHMKTMKQGRDKAVANANKLLDGPRAWLYTKPPAEDPSWRYSYSCTSPRLQPIL